MARMCAWAQDSTEEIMAAPTALITGAIDETQLATLKGNTHPLARPEFDLGTAPASLPMQRMLLVLKRSPQQEAALAKLLDDQQDKNSPNYHKWLSPEQFGKQFGPTDSDMQVVTTWLESHGFEVGATKGRTVLEFSGSASQVRETFHTTIHKYLVNGEQHWANASDPQIPAALTPAIAGVSSLNDFRPKPMNAPAGTFSRDPATGKITPVRPEFTFPSGCVESNASQNLCYYALGPYDFATIYDVLPLWNAGINGTGETIAIVGESNIKVQDVSNFRSMFGLPANNPTVILNGPDPGIQGDESEADIDVQWSGAVAPNATIDFVVSQSTETTAGVDLSAVYIVENNLAGVMSESYGYCELGLGTSGNQFYNALWQQAAAEGITILLSAGDNGAAGCDDFNGQRPAPAQYGLQVSGFASTPYNVAVGGTDFNDFSNPATYWSTTNNSTTQASALSYIPETTWNDSCTNSIFSVVGFGTNAENRCNNSQLVNFVVPEGGSGGVSNCTTPSGSTPASCAGGYAKPSWQSGAGVPADGKRDLPDVSLFASNGFLGSFYIICQSDRTYGTCGVNDAPSYFLGFGGTSVSSPAFAGIMALVNQQTGSRQGNANYVLYKLAAQQPTAFHDVTSGTIAMPCMTNSANCTTNTPGHAYGVLNGYSAGPGYDLATGLGSVDANILVTKWSSVTLLPSVTTLSSLTPTTITHGQAVNFSASVAAKSGTGATPTGVISLAGSPTNSSQSIAGFNLVNGAVSGSTDLLPGGTYSVTAHYPGDSTYGPSDSSPISVTVGKENSQPQVFLVTFDPNGNVINGNSNTAVYGSPYILRVNVENAAGQMCNPVAASGSTGCPSGNVALTSNGATLDAGTYTLNSYGYLEDFAVQLPGGTDSVKAAYGGDSSFDASSATTPFSMTPATTTMGAVTGACAQPGCPSFLQIEINTQSSGAEPTGTVTFYSNGTPLTGQVILSGWAGGTATASAYLQANLTAAAFAKPGTYVLTASYSGDSNYAAASSPATSVMVQYAQPQILVQPSSATVQSGSQMTLTAEVVATGNITPTGTVNLNAGYGFPLPNPTYSTVINPSTGYPDLVATVTFTPAFGTVYFAQYSGDANYPANNNAQSPFVAVSGNDFTLILSGAAPAPISPGQLASVGLFVGVQSAPVSFATSPCSGLPLLTTCSVNPLSVTTESWPTLTIHTTAPTASSRLANDYRPPLWPRTTLGLSALFVIALPRKKRSLSLALCLLLATLLLLPSCGGGSSATSSSGGGVGGGGNPGTPAGTYPITVTATSGTGSTAITHTVTFNLVVQ